MVCTLRSMALAALCAVAASSGAVRRPGGPVCGRRASAICDSVRTGFMRSSYTRCRLWADSPRPRTPHAVSPTATRAAKAIVAARRVPMRQRWICGARPWCHSRSSSVAPHGGWVLAVLRPCISGPPWRLAWCCAHARPCATQGAAGGSEGGKNRRTCGHNLNRCHQALCVAAVARHVRGLRAAAQQGPGQRREYICLHRAY